MDSENSERKVRKRNFYKYFTPPPQWRFPVILSLGIFVGLIFYIFYISRAYSYMLDDPNACINCHVMIPQYTTWERSSHGRVATCNDCHVPQDNFIESYAFKAKDGLYHSYMFTFRLEPQVINMKEAGVEAVQQNCIRCHENQLHPISVRAVSNDMIMEGSDVKCWDCHRSVPHGMVNSLSSAPYVNAPNPKPAIPEWLRNFLGK